MIKTRKQKTLSQSIKENFVHFYFRKKKMRLINFRIPAAIVGFVPATIVGFALIASATIKPAMAAPDAMVLFGEVPEEGNPFNGKQIAAAAGEGSSDLDVYRDANQKKLSWLGGFNFGAKGLSSNADNQISSVNIRAGRWRFYNSAGWGSLGGSIILGPGRWNIPLSLNDKISSIQRF